MPFELIYTSAEQGLRHGSSGFCTVACSEGISPNMAIRLEQLSVYRHLITPTSLKNPVVHAHFIFQQDGQLFHVLSRIADNGVDYTNRSNKIAHHIIFKEEETARLGAGPAAILARDDLFMKDWKEPPRILPQRREFLVEDSGPKICSCWEKTVGDAGWGGYLAANARLNMPVCLRFGLGQQILPLFREAMSLLNPADRWNISFCTFFTKLPPNIRCLWNAVPVNAPEEGILRAVPGTLFLDLTQKEAYAVPEESNSQVLVQMARTGEKFIPQSNESREDPLSEKISDFYNENGSNNSFLNAQIHKLEVCPSTESLRPHPQTNSPQGMFSNLAYNPDESAGKFNPIESTDMFSGRTKQSNRKKFFGRKFGIIALCSVIFLLLVGIIVLLFLLKQKSIQYLPPTTKNAKLASNVQKKKSNQSALSESSNKAEESVSSGKTVSEDNVDGPESSDKSVDKKKMDGVNNSRKPAKAEENEQSEERVVKKDNSIKKTEADSSQVPGKLSKVNPSAVTPTDLSVKGPPSLTKNKEVKQSTNPDKPVNSVSQESDKTAELRRESQNILSGISVDQTDLNIVPKKSSNSTAPLFTGDVKGLFEYVKKNQLNLRFKYSPILTLTHSDNSKRSFYLEKKAKKASFIWQICLPDKKNEKQVLYELNLEKNEIEVTVNGSRRYENQLALFAYVTISIYKGSEPLASKSMPLLRAKPMLRPESFWSTFQILESQKFPIIVDDSWELRIEEQDGIGIHLPLKRLTESSLIKFMSEYLDKYDGAKFKDLSVTLISSEEKVFPIQIPDSSN